MNLSILVLRRRSGVERMVIRIIRGNPAYSLPAANKMLPAKFTAKKPYTLDKEQFTILRKCSIRHGLKIQPDGTQYLTRGEAAILLWLTEAQRSTGPVSLYLEDADLYTAVVRCALILKLSGYLLPSRTLKMDLQLHEGTFTNMHSLQ